MRALTSQTWMRMVALLVMASAGGAACVGPALEQRTSNNGAYAVDYLFTTDGCRVYRFKDGGTHYFVRCDSPGVSGMATSTQTCGKGCVREESIASTTAPATPDGTPASGSAPPGPR